MTISEETKETIMNAAATVLEFEDGEPADEALDLIVLCLEKATMRIRKTNRGAEAYQRVIGRLQAEAERRRAVKAVTP